MKRLRLGLSAMFLLLAAACVGTSSPSRLPDETFLPSIGSGWSLAAKRSASPTAYEAPIPGHDGIYIFRAGPGTEVSIKTPRGKVVEIKREWRGQSLDASLLPGWRAYSNREGLLLVFYGAPSRNYVETRLLILGDTVKSVRFLAHDGSRLTDQTTSY